MLFSFSLKSIAVSKSWKVLIYMQADNDLAPYAYWDIAELEVSASESIPVLIDLDLPGDDGIQRLKVKKRKNNVLFNKENFENWSLRDLNSNVELTIPEYDKSQDEELLDFLLWADEKYPTDHTFLVIWGHGEGFGGSSSSFGGVALDQAPSSKLSIIDISKVFNSYHEKTGEMLDIVAMDACLMQTLEVSVELASFVDYFIGSTQIQDFRGLPYNKILSFMAKLERSGGVSPYSLARKVPSLFEESAVLEFDYDQRTMSSLNSKELMGRFIPSFRDVMKDINRYFSQNFFEKIIFKSDLQYLPSFLGESSDLNTFLVYLEDYFSEKKEQDIVFKLGEASRALSRSLLSYYYGEFYLDDELFYLGAFKAFSVWLPKERRNYVDRELEFNKSALFQIAPEWKSFLDSLFVTGIR